MARSFLGMGNDIADDVGVAHHVEIEPLVLVDASLPAVPCFVVLLGVKRRVLEVAGKERHLLEERLAHIGRGGFSGLHRAGDVVNVHRTRLVFLAALFFSWPFMCAIISSAVLKGPSRGEGSQCSSNALGLLRD